MSREEAKGLFDSIKDKLELKFCNYYKYSFSFYGEVDGIKVRCSYGGISDDIYRYEVGTEPIKFPKDFDEFCEEWNYFRIERDDKEFVYLTPL